jgi:hypothetical protein
MCAAWRLRARPVDEERVMIKRCPEKRVLF